MEDAYQMNQHIRANCERRIPPPTITPLLGACDIYRPVGPAGTAGILPAPAETAPFPAGGAWRLGGCGAFGCGEPHRAVRGLPYAGVPDNAVQGRGVVGSTTGVPPVNGHGQDGRATPNDTTTPVSGRMKTYASLAIIFECAYTIMRPGPRTSNGSSIPTRPSVGRS